MANIAQSRIDRNFISGGWVRDEDWISFFGDMTGKLPEGETYGVLDENWRFPDLLVSLGIFPSKGQARKNGWDKDIPEGWTDITIGKLKHRICILKRTKEWVDHEDLSGGTEPSL